MEPQKSDQTKIQTAETLTFCLRCSCLLSERARDFQRAISYAFLILLTAAIGPGVFGQEAIPFQVSNPKHRKWS